MGDFWIPVNIAHRADEIENLNEKIGILVDELTELQKGDDEFSGKADDEKNILALRKKIEAALGKIQQEEKGHSAFQKKPIGEYKISEMKDVGFNPKIIRELREHRIRIKGTMGKLAEVKQMNFELSNLIIMQDIENGAKTIGRMANKLKERIQYTQ
jgi:hypothetical protein